MNLEWCLYFSLSLSAMVLPEYIQRRMNLHIQKKMKFIHQAPAIEPPWQASVGGGMAKESEAKYSRNNRKTRITLSL